MLIKILIIKYWIVLLSFFGISLLLGCDVWISHATSARLYQGTIGLKNIPARRVGLVLGTSPMNGNGSPNSFFKFRIKAAVRLYQAGKIDYILVSGDNQFKSYNEPRAMHQALIAQGIPNECITLDYAGFRTLDSIIRAQAVFSENDFIVISQAFHNQRALFIGDYYGMNLLGFNADDVATVFQWKVRLREVLARFKAVLDLYILGTEPHFFGDKISIPTPLEIQQDSDDILRTSTFLN
jgi:SanA protein